MDGTSETMPYNPEGTPSDTTLLTEQSFALPEGVDLDKDALEKFKPLISDHKLSPEAAQSLIDLACDMQSRSKQRLNDQDIQTSKDWIDQARKDPDYGGQAFERNLLLAQQTLDRFGSDELRSILDHSGLGDHPEMIRLFVTIGRLISEDTFISSNPSVQPAQARTPAEIIFGS